MLKMFESEALQIIDFQSNNVCWRWTLHISLSSQPGSSVPVLECHECTCTWEVDPGTQLYKISCSMVVCKEDCAPVSRVAASYWLFSFSWVSDWLIIGLSVNLVFFLCMSFRVTNIKSPKVPKTAVGNVYKLTASSMSTAPNMYWRWGQRSLHFWSPWRLASEYLGWMQPKGTVYLKTKQCIIYIMIL